jgi:hypothetical protein
MFWLASDATRNTAAAVVAICMLFLHIENVLQSIIAALAALEVVMALACCDEEGTVVMFRYVFAIVVMSADFVVARAAHVGSWLQSKPDVFIIIFCAVSMSALTFLGMVFIPEYLSEAPNKFAGDSFLHSLIIWHILWMEAVAAETEALPGLL